MKILTASQMRQVDMQTTDRFGIPSLLLMENAGRSVVEQMEKHFGELAGRSVLIVCGKGNNGGDGFVVARQLRMRGGLARVLLLTTPSALKGDARINFEVLQKMEDVPIETILEEDDEATAKLGDFFGAAKDELVVDGLLGTGIRLPVRGFAAEVIKHLRNCGNVVAIDIPSGLECDSLRSETEELLAPVADLTVTFTAPKPAHVFLPAAEFSRKWVVVSIGTPCSLIEQSGSWLNYVTSKEVEEALRSWRRRPDSHKGDFGHVAVVAGSVGKTGAAGMTAKSAFQAGAGLVTVAVPAPCLPVVASQSLEIMTQPLEATEVGSFSTKAFDYGRVESFIEGKTVIALGPGLGTHAETVQFVRRLVTESPLPIVLDADGLNAFVGRAELLTGREEPLVLTPHPGEFSRLLGISTQDLLMDRVHLARNFALQHQLHLVLKGHRTLYAAPSGEVYVNSTGNPGMATGGSGDVLTGILAGILAQRLSRPREQSMDRCVEGTLPLAVFLHGLAGDLARELRGEQSLVASDIIDNISAAYRSLDPGDS